MAIAASTRAHVSYAAARRIHVLNLDQAVAPELPDGRLMQASVPGPFDPTAVVIPAGLPLGHQAQSAHEQARRVNDRGPYTRGAIVDLSKAFARRIGLMGRAPVRLQILGHR